MNADVKEKWVAALRSGEYQQGKNYLHKTDDTYCCLGVLCELAVAEGVIPAGARFHLGDPFYTYIDRVGSMPPQVEKWAELIDDESGHVLIDETRARLARHNDDGRTFAEIADAIEAQL